jgi:hypothetical protein
VIERQREKLIERKNRNRKDRKREIEAEKAKERSIESFVKEFL